MRSSYGLFGNNNIMYAVWDGLCSWSVTTEPCTVLVNCENTIAPVSHYKEYINSGST